MNFLRTSIASLNKQSLRDIANTFNDEITHLTSHSQYMQWNLAVPDALKSKLNSPVPPKKTRNFHKIFAA